MNETVEEITVRHGKVESGANKARRVLAWFAHFTKMNLNEKVLNPEKTIKLSLVHKLGSKSQLSEINPSF